MKQNKLKVAVLKEKKEIENNKIGKNVNTK